jgi:hypothetical protein
MENTKTLEHAIAEQHVYIDLYTNCRPVNCLLILITSFEPLRICTRHSISSAFCLLVIPVRKHVAMIDGIGRL